MATSPGRPWPLSPEVTHRTLAAVRAWLARYTGDRAVLGRSVDDFVQEGFIRILTRWQEGASYELGDPGGGTGGTSVTLFGLVRAAALNHRTDLLRSAGHRLELPWLADIPGACEVQTVDELALFLDQLGPPGARDLRAHLPDHARRGAERPRRRRGAAPAPPRRCLLRPHRPSGVGHPQARQAEPGPVAPRPLLSRPRNARGSQRKQSRLARLPKEVGRAA